MSPVVFRLFFSPDPFTNDDDYKLCKKVRIGDVISVVGPVALNNANRLSIFPKTPPEIVGGDVAIPIGQTDLPYRAAGSKMIQARIIKHMREFLDKNKYIEIEPRYLSANWAGDGLEPIKAVFPGSGCQYTLLRRLCLNFSRFLSPPGGNKSMP